MILAVVRNELRRLFRSPLAWTLLGVVTFLLAFLFLIFLDNFTAEILPHNTGAEAPIGTTSAIILPLSSWAGIILLCILPLITMRSLSTEYQTNTWQLFAASPIRPWQIITGKYLASLIFLSAVAGIVILMQLSLLFGSQIDMGVLFSNNLGLWLLLAASTAAGIYFSSLTSETGTAALATFGLLLFLYMLETAAKIPGNASPIFYYLSPWTHHSAFLEARFSTLHLIYFLLFACLFLWLAIRQIRKKLGLLQSARILSLLEIIVGVSIIAGLAWLSMGFTLQADLSRQKSNSLPHEAIAILEQMQQPIKITARVENKPEIKRRIQAAFMPLQQHKPDIEIALIDNKLHRLQQQHDLNETSQLLIEYQDRQVKLFALDRKKILGALHQLAKGKQSWLIFLQDHGEINLTSSENEGASRLAAQLESQGFEIYSHSLIRNPVIPDNTDILVIAGPVQAFLQTEVKAIADYIATGGSLLWLHDHSDLFGLDELLDILPVEFLPGVIVNADQNVQQLIGSKHPAVYPVIDYHNHPLTANLDGQSILAFSRALEPTGQPPWQARSFLQTPRASWNETGSLAGQIKPDTEAELTGPFSVGLSLSRQFGDLEQRVIIVGDKDFISNEMIGYGRNNELALRIFNWLNPSAAPFELPTEQIPDATLDLSALQLNVIAALFLFILPLIFLLLGLRQWRYYRRHA